MAKPKEVAVAATIPAPTVTSAPELNFYLIVRTSFMTYQRGDQITDPAVIKEILDPVTGYSQHVHKIPFTGAN